MQKQELYEKKILNDDEFPIQVHMNDVKEPGCYFSAHWHEHIELHYVVEGRTQIRINQEDVGAEKEDLIIVNSNELHAGYCDGSHMKALVVIFEMETFSKELAGKNIILQSLIRKDPEIDHLMKTIWREQAEHRLGYRLCCKGAVMYLIAHLVRSYAAEVLSDQDNTRRMKNLERLNTTITYIHEHYRNPISNKELSDLIHLSEGRFNHLFKESMNMAPLQYINTVRLKKAMSLLRSKEFTVAEAALAVGFTDYNHFGRMFRKFYGCTPVEARKI